MINDLVLLLPLHPWPNAFRICRQISRNSRAPFPTPYAAQRQRNFVVHSTVVLSIQLYLSTASEHDETFLAITSSAPLYWLAGPLPPTPISPVSRTRVLNNNIRHVRKGMSNHALTHTQHIIHGGDDDNNEDNYTSGKSGRCLRASTKRLNGLAVIRESVVCVGSRNW